MEESMQVMLMATEMKKRGANAPFTGTISLPSLRTLGDELKAALGFVNAMVQLVSALAADDVPRSVDTIDVIMTTKLAEETARTVMLYANDLDFASSRGRSACDRCCDRV
jgi:hypothetical protein